MQVRWIRCRTYHEAKDFRGAVYLHEWDGRPFYWGICDRSVFGGNRSEMDGVRRNPRYGTSYRHWIEACLRYGGSLYMGVPSDIEKFSLQDLELTLIAQYPSEMNDKENALVLVKEIVHTGDVPPSIKGTGA